MSGLALLKAGIKEADWLKVCEGYRAIAGETLPAPAVERESDAAVLKKVEQTLQETVALIQHREKLDPKSHPDRTEKPRKKTQPKNGSGIVIAKEMPEDSVFQDVLKKNEIDGEAPDVLTKAIKTQEVDCYGNKREIITADVRPGEKRLNTLRAERAKPRKGNRAPATGYEVTCGACGKTFRSPVKPPKDIGVKCSKCIGSLREARAGDDDDADDIEDDTEK